MPHGYHGRILHVDLSTQSTRIEEADEIFWRTYIGGGLLGTKLVFDHVPAGADPLGPDNILAFVSSVVAGTPAPAMARFSTIARSPLTGGVGETRTEGPFGAALKCSGFDAVVFHGRAAEPVAAILEDRSVRFVSAAEPAGADVPTTTEAVRRAAGAESGAEVHVAAIGPAGEKLVRFASIVTDRGYQASRMGMGAVMGSKNLKAFAIVGRPAPPTIADTAAVASIAADFAAAIPKNDLTRWQAEPPGFSCWVYLHGLDAALSVNNYSRAELAGIEAYKEERFLERQIEELGCPDCPVGCIKSIRPGGAGANPADYAIHQEATGALGVNLGLTDLDAVLKASQLCNRFGMDPTSLGYTLSAAMEMKQAGAHGTGDARGSHDAGTPDLSEVPDFGDAAGVLRLIEAVAHRRGVGDHLAEGSLRFARLVGAGATRYAMQVKGLEMVPFEPRSQTNLALGYAVAPIGPRYDICEHDWDFDTEVGWDHTLRYSRTLGILERIPMDYLGPEKVRNFKALWTLWSAADALDMCIFAVAPTRILSLDAMSRLVAAITGWETSSYEIMKIGERRLHLMRAFNAREGIGSEADTLPDRFFDEPLSGSKREGDVLDRRRFGEAVRTLYAMMGWDASGVPTEATMLEAGLPVDFLSTSR